MSIRKYHAGSGQTIHVGSFEFGIRVQSANIAITLIISQDKNDVGSDWCVPHTVNLYGLGIWIDRSMITANKPHHQKHASKQIFHDEVRLH